MKDFMDLLIRWHFCHHIQIHHPTSTLSKLFKSMTPSLPFKHLFCNADTFESNLFRDTNWHILNFSSYYVNNHITIHSLEIHFFSLLLGIFLIFLMQLNLRRTRDNSRWSQVASVPAPLPVPVQRRVIPHSSHINKGSEDKLDCRIGDNVIDVDYIDIALKRGCLKKFIGCGYLNLSNPLLKKVSYSFVINSLLLIWYLILVSKHFQGSTSGEFLCPVSRHQSGIIYLSSVDPEIIEVFKDRLKCRLQPQGFAYYGGLNCFNGGQGMSIPTLDFELCLEEFSWADIQVIMLQFNFDVFCSFSHVWSFPYCILLS